MSRLTATAAEIRKGNIAKDTMEDFLSSYREKAFRISCLRFMMESYNQLLFRADKSLSEDAEQFCSRINEMTDLLFFKEEEQDAEEIVIGLRSDLLTRMEVLMAYQSAFETFRHAILRSLPVDEKQLPVDTDEIAKEFLTFMFESSDNMVTNIRIAEVIKELPIRYTRGKFLELVTDAMKRYLGAERAAFFGLCFQVEQEALFFSHPHITAFYKDFYEEVLMMKTMDFSVLSKEEIQKSKEHIDTLIEECQARLDLCFHFMAVVNELYSLIRVKKGTDLCPSERELTCITLLQNAHKDLTLLDEAYEEKVDRIFTEFEGKLETILEETFFVEDVLEQLEVSCKSEMQEHGLFDIFEGLTEFVLLNHDPHLNFEELKNKEGLVTEKDLDVAFASLTENFQSVFREVKKPIRKSIMARVLGLLPVPFTTRTEVMEYVRTSLSTCDRKEEIAACLHAVHDFRRENDYDS